ncbi:phage/plasmid primase, P4 family [Thalassospira sp. TSL5-1]|uniref:DNA primase family protein n=1 Tax=Thalassospira sp. TSL5-1 TaxID=1544451 RepID=UPI00093F8FA9|nr:phage/plasmid primase, P4 family [Thalassospira sp. TSL5-1]
MASGANAIRAAIGGADILSFPGGGGEDVNLLLAEKERNDIGNAERFLARHGQDLLYVREVGWHCWNGTHWAPDGSDEAVKQKAHETARSIMEEVAALQKQGRPDVEKDEPGYISVGDWNQKLADLMKWSISSGNRQKLHAMVGEAEPYISVAPEMMDFDPYLLNVQNGTIRMQGACDELRDHDRGDRLAKIMNVEYDPDATCPTFNKFLSEVQPDEEIRLFLQIWSGYCLTGITSEQKLVFNYGEGGNGKSVFIDLIAKMMGPYSLSLPFASLLRDDRKRGSEATPDLARLPGARLVRASEPEKGSRFAEATIKAITGGEEITVRHLNYGFFDFVPQFKLTLSGNHKPAIRGQDRGIWRRFLLVPWEVNVPEEKQDKDLPAKLWAERSGVLNWLLDGVRIWLERGLFVPDAVLAATNEYRADSDPIGRFLNECVKPSKYCAVQAAAMYDAYKSWCNANAERPWSMTAFGKVLPERGYQKSDGRIREYLNVELVNVPDGNADNSEPPPADNPGDYV